MAKPTIKSLQAIIDQQAEQLSTAHRRINELEHSNRKQVSIRRAAMEAARSEAKRLGVVSLAKFH